MAEPILLRCPIRGRLNMGALAKDGLTITEEARRIEFIKFLISRHYPPSHIAVEKIVIDSLGEGGRNKVRCDVIVYDSPTDSIIHLNRKSKLKKAILVAEIKRDASKKDSAIKCQLLPALRQIPSMKVMGAYWDDLSRILYVKKLESTNGNEYIEIYEDVLENIPRYGTKYKAQPITVDKLYPPGDLVAVLGNVANIMRSHGVNDDRLRYRETVKLILARYCDEREAAESETKIINLQIMPGNDPGFYSRVNDYYTIAANRYNKAKTLYSLRKESELDDRTLREIIKLIQGLRFSDTSNEIMQQVFNSFVPVVFKKKLDQYFTPLSLIDTMVEMVNIGPNDKVVDPGMGTGDFLTAAMELRIKAGDTDIDKRVFGIDIEQNAFDLAIINMILNKDGQTNLLKDDSIAKYNLWHEEIEVALCNPPFGENSIEKRHDVLSNYDLGHLWEFNSIDNKWYKTDKVLKSQQLGILFIERCYKFLPNSGRMAIILPEGYLCTKCYGYVRQWLVDNMRILSLIELPRSIFKKSNADLRANIVVTQKINKDDLKYLIDMNYPIHAEIVRKVGYKLGKGYNILPLRDSETGIMIRDENNRILVDSDFNGVRERFQIFSQKMKWRSPVKMQSITFDNWEGAKISDVLDHKDLDLKPRRLTHRALMNKRLLLSSPHVFLEDIVDIVEPSIDLRNDSEPNEAWCLVEGRDIRAFEGIVVPQYPSKSWEIIERKGAKMFRLKSQDIIVGLVRPETRNIGLLLSDKNNVVGAPDGIAVIRVKADKIKKYSPLWLFSILRSEICRLQFWTESGGTSYGKLTNAHILKTILPEPSKIELIDTTKKVIQWFNSFSDAARQWDKIGSEEDRRPIRNSPMNGLEAPDDFD